MNDAIGPGSLLDTTDSLEAVGVFRGWKNLMFLVVFLCLLVVQGGFWLVNLGLIDAECGCCDEAACGQVVCDVNAPDAAAVAGSDAAAVDPNKSGEPNKPAEAATTEAPVEAESDAEEAKASSVLDDILRKVNIHRFGMGLRIVNAILILSACLYVLTILFSLKVSIVGKLGGINHVSRAFFLGLIMFVLILPWQRIFGGAVVGMIYSKCELLMACSAEREDLIANVLYYLRFCGYWLLIFLMLLMTQTRTCRWTRAILRRLEVV